MAKVRLTAGRIAAFQCDHAKSQEFLWCADVPGLGIRATNGSDDKVYIYQAKVNGKTMRSTIGKVSMWSIPDAQAEARRLQVMPQLIVKPVKMLANRKLKTICCNVNSCNYGLKL